MASKLRCLIAGAPGAGKGTIASKIVKKYGLLHLSTGDMLRAQIAANTKLGKEAQTYIKSGGLVPDSLIVKMVLDEMKGKEDGWLLDGFPRTVDQAKALTAVTQVQMCVNLDVPFDTIVERIKQRMVHPASGRVYHLQFNPPKKAGVDDVTGEPLVRRADDEPSVVMARLKAYEAQTKPVLDYYSQFGLTVNFPGTESNVLWPQVEKYIDGYAAGLKARK